MIAQSHFPFFRKTGRHAGCAIKIKNDYPSKIFLIEGVYKAALEQQQWIKQCSRYGFYNKQR